MNLEEDQANAMASLSFEEAMSEADALTRQLESGTLSLADSLTAYQRGAELLRHAQRLLEQVQSELDIIDEAGQQTANIEDVLGGRT